MLLSIIIPTLNEEKYLPGLLASIKKQDFKDYQIILADAGSKDATLEIAKQYGCIIVPGGLPAKARNNGARAASGEILFFLDADTWLADRFLTESLGEFQKRKLDVASFCLIPYPKETISSLFLNVCYNSMIIASQKVLAHGAMGILVKQELFFVLNGFDEDIKLAEDHDLVRRAAKLGKFGIIRSQKLLFSDRRFKKEGWIRVGITYFLCELYMIFIGPVKSDIFNYQFNHYQEKK